MPPTNPVLPPMPVSGSAAPLPQEAPAGLMSRLPHILGALGGLRGNRGFAARWQQLEQQAAQQKQQGQQQAMAQEQLGFQRDANTRAANADTRAQQDQRLQAVATIRQLLGDDSIDAPDLYDQREAFATNLAPQLGVDAGFVRSLRPTPDVFTKRKLQGVYTKFEKLPQSEREAFEQGGHWEIGGQTYTPARIRQELGFGGVDAQGRPFVNAPPPPKRGFTTKDILWNGKRVLAGFDPDTNTYYAPGDTTTPLTGDIQEYAKPLPPSGDGLPPRTQTQVSAQARTFESLPVVKNTQIMSEAVSFAKSLDPQTKNPADDQALIYAFAKAMDPNSVVREGEYATVQKYAQSWAQSFGFNAARIFSNTTFLTPEARQNMKRTIQSKFLAAKGQYDAVRRSYIQKINKLTGMADGEDWLTDYGAAFPTDASAPAASGRATVTPTPAAPARIGGPGAAPGANPFRR